MVEHKDVVLALIGVSAVLAGLVLVFLGFIVAALQTYGAETDKSVLSPLRWSAMFVIVTFTLGLLSVGLAAWWLVSLGESRALYDWTVVTFVGQLVSLAIATVAIAKRLVWG